MQAFDCECKYCLYTEKSKISMELVTFYYLLKSVQYLMELD